MIRLRLDMMATAVKGTLYNSQNSARVFSGVSIDSRSVQPNELFFAIRGERFDGHEFIKDAINKGAAGIVAEQTYPSLENLPGTVGVVGVTNCHQALTDLAKAWRNRTAVQVIGITGSNGKTTTRELSYQLLHAVEKNSYRSPGNLNNLYGLPLAILGMPQNTKFAVLELGISTPGEMLQLAKLADPDLIVITNIGPSHLQFLSSVEEVAQAKLELVRKAKADTPVILNGDDKVLIAEAAGMRDRFFTFGFDDTNDYRIDSIEVDEDGSSLVTIKGNCFRLPLPGRHQVSNLLAAYAVADTLGLSFDDVDTRSIELSTASWRGEIVHRGEIRWMVDCYNANPESMKAGLIAFFGASSNERRKLILGDMLELGDDAVEYHREIGKQLALFEFDSAVMVGPLSRNLMETAHEQGIPSGKLTHFDTVADYLNASELLPRSGEFVYLKGSRGVGLEKILDRYEDNRGTN